MRGAPMTSLVLTRLMDLGLELTSALDTQAADVQFSDQAVLQVKT